ncbi:MAG: hypothetical protein ACI9R3_005209 [Verrucomicrobiales bacterium]|jgi:hypothetical protein
MPAPRSPFSKRNAGVVFGSNAAKVPKVPQGFQNVSVLGGGSRRAADGVSRCLEVPLSRQFAAPVKRSWAIVGGWGMKCRHPVARSRKTLRWVMLRALPIRKRKGLKNRWNAVLTEPERYDKRSRVEPGEQKYQPQDLRRFRSTILGTRNQPISLTLPHL